MRFPAAALLATALFAGTAQAQTPQSVIDLLTAGYDIITVNAVLYMLEDTQFEAALRSLARSLHKELTPHGVRTGIVHIHGTMKPGTLYDPAHVADAFWAVHTAGSGDNLPEIHFKPDGGHGGDPDAT